MAKRKLTRKVLNCPVFGSPCQLSDNLLPTYQDVMKYYTAVKNGLKSQAAGQEPKVADICEMVTREVERVWIRASIPVVSHTRVVKLLRTYHDKYQKLLKPYKARHKQDTYKKQLRDFQEKAKETLFDISSCKCDDENKCNCEKNRKIPNEEKPFLRDQRTTRLMCISNVDRIASEKLSKKQNRNQAQQSQEVSYNKSLGDNAVPGTSRGERKDTLASVQRASESESDDDIPLAALQAKIRYQRQRRNSRKLPTLARACDRHGVSDRAAAAIASAVLEDFGILSKEDCFNVIDRNKVRRSRQTKRTAAQKIGHEGEFLRSLYFDGRKDQTIINTRKGSRWYRSKIVEEHLSIIEEPGSKYIGHTTPASGSADDIKQSIITFLNNRFMNLDNLTSIGCDGTNVNTGNVGGIIVLIEKELQKPLQWLVCQLHANELPLRHLIKHLDGETCGPRAFKGVIGKQLNGCETLPVVKFEPIEGEMPTIKHFDLSTDQRYLRDICDAVSTGMCSESLSRRYPGALSHSRWLTAANRLVRLYVSTENPSNSLKVIVTFIIKVYAPMWFIIKMNPSCKDGAKHVWQTIQRSRYLSTEFKDVIDPVIQRNAYFAHPENLLLSMITDERKTIRELGMRRILRARSESSGLRKFSIPTLNFNAQNYIDLIDWQMTDVTEPPLLADLPVDSIEMLVASGEAPVIDFPKYPCHTQAVERCVKLVTEASASVCGEMARDGFIRVRLESRKLMPYFNTKADYISN